MLCKICGYDGNFPNGICPKCNTKIEISKEDISNYKSQLKDALLQKEYESAMIHYETLISCDDLDSIKEYAKILEDGVLVPQNLARATLLYKRGAEKNDGFCAYRYSKLVSTSSAILGTFWLIYAASLGEVESYVPAAKELSRMGKEVEANHFFTLASDADHKEATMLLAKRYLNGIGFSEPNPEYAKWYLKKYRIPSLYAIPMLFKLRKTGAKEPPRVEFNQDSFLKMLVRMSLEAECETATLRLCETLGSRGDLSALASAGMMKVQNMGTYGEADEGLRILRECAVRGSSDAYMTLGELYREGKYITGDIDASIFNYEMAAKSGRADAYAALGDIFTDGEHIDRDFALALECYEQAEKLGSVKGERRVKEIRSQREKIYKEALLTNDDDEKFKLFAISCAMGHPMATTRLGECYEKGIGTKIDSVSAYNWYLTAVKRGENSALVPLGRCYADGFGVNRDYKLALECLNRADKLSDKRADDIIKRIYEAKKRKIAKRVYSQAMRLVHIGKSEIAVELLNLSEKLEYPKAIYSLGCLYEFGMGVPVDKDKAYAMYERAFRLLFRDPRAKFKLSILRKAKETLMR